MFQNIFRYSIKLKTEDLSSKVKAIITHLNNRINLIKSGCRLARRKIKINEMTLQRKTYNNFASLIFIYILKTGVVPAKDKMKMATFSFHAAVQGFFDAISNAKCEDLSLLTTENSWDSIIGSDSEKKSALDQAFRQALTSKLQETGS